MFFSRCRALNLIIYVNLLFVFILTGCSFNNETFGTGCDSKSLEKIETLGLQTPQELFQNDNFLSYEYQTAPDERWVSYITDTQDDTKKIHFGKFLNGECFSIGVSYYQPIKNRSEALALLKSWLPEKSISIDERDNKELGIKSLKNPTEYFYFGTKYSALINFTRMRDKLKVSTIKLSKIKSPEESEKKEIAKK